MNEITKKTIQSKTNWRRWIVYICVMVTTISVVAGCVIYATRICIDTSSIEATNKAVEELRTELKESQRRIDVLDERVKKEAKRIRIKERAYVDTLPSDAVATAIASELRTFIGDGEEDLSYEGTD